MKIQSIVAVYLAYLRGELFLFVERFLTDKECRELTSLSRTTLWRARKAGNFPPMYRLSDGRSGYKFSEVLEWLNSRSVS